MSGSIILSNQKATRLMVYFAIPAQLLCSILQLALCSLVPQAFCEDRPSNKLILSEGRPSPGRRPGNEADLEPSFWLLFGFRYQAIVKYKTAFYSFYLPVALAMYMVRLTYYIKKTK